MIMHQILLASRRSQVSLVLTQTMQIFLLMDKNQTKPLRCYKNNQQKWQQLVPMQATFLLSISYQPSKAMPQVQSQDNKQLFRFSSIVKFNCQIKTNSNSK